MKASPHPNLADLLLRFAQGDQEAQAATVRLAFDSIEKGQVSAENGLGVAEFCARIAAARGDAKARFVLASTLLLMADVWRSIAGKNGAKADAGGSDGISADNWRADALLRQETADAWVVEAVAILDELAGEGDEAAADLLNRAAERICPTLLNGAQIFPEFWRETDAGPSGGEAVEVS